MISPKFEEFILCLEEQRFYDAHESLEEVWFPMRFEKNSEVKLIKGFINAAVSFELYKRGRILQSKKVWSNYLKYRPLLSQLQTQNQNIYHQLSRRLEAINSNKITEITLL
jgi:hypothetical protein